MLTGAIQNLRHKGEKYNPEQTSIIILVTTIACCGCCWRVRRVTIHEQVGTQSL